MAKHLEPVALCQLDQFGNRLVRAALPTSFIGWRSPIFARSCTLPAASSLAQKICIQLRTILPINNPFRGATLGSISQLVRYKVEALRSSWAPWPHLPI